MAKAQDLLDAPRPAGAQSPAMASVALQAHALLPFLHATLCSTEAESRHYRYVAELEPRLEYLIDRHARHVLYRMSRQGQLSGLMLDECRRAAPETALFLDWLLARLARPQADGNWLVSRPQFDKGCLDYTWSSLLREYPQFLPIVHACGRIDLYLHHLLTGTRPVDEAYPQYLGATELYHQVSTEISTHGIARVLIDRIQQARLMSTPEQHLGLLEIGPFGPVFSHELSEMAKAVRCDYTYLSPRDSATANVAPADLVIFHTDYTANAEALQALRFASRHLKPGGTLLLRGLQPAAWMDFLYGARNSWWIDDLDDGKASPQSSQAYWQAQLIQLGLVCSEVPLEYAPGISRGAYQLIATLPASYMTFATAPRA